MICASGGMSLFQYTFLSQHDLKPLYARLTADVGELMFLGLKRNMQVPYKIKYDPLLHDMGRLKKVFFIYISVVLFGYTEISHI